MRECWSATTAAAFSILFPHTGSSSLAVQSDDLLWDECRGTAGGDVTGVSGRLHRLTAGRTSLKPGNKHLTCMQRSRGGIQT